MMKSDFTLKLMEWNRQANGRAMPWKGEKDPYKIWLSEVILQQTRVEQGWSYYEKFIAAFPTVYELARADDKEVFKLWEGLGYYSRCKNLLHTARMVVDQYNGQFPTTFEELQRLKGVGPYTAAAIASFAFNEAQAVVDGNVQRVIARYFGISTPVDTASGKKMYHTLAQALLDPDEPGLYNQAIMDFGAVICKPQNPLCHECVQQPECEAFAHGLVKQLPVKEKALIKKQRWFYYFIVQYKNSVYIRMRKEKDIWENLHEFVLYESTGSLDTPVQELPFWKEIVGEESYSIEAISPVYRQQLTHQTIHGQFILIRINNPLPALEKDYLLIEKQQLGAYAFPRFITAFLRGKSTPAQLF